MALEFDSTSLRFSTLSIQDCLGCKNVHLRFSQDTNVHLLIYSLDKSSVSDRSSTPTVTPIAQALQLLCTTEYLTAESLQQLPQLTIGKGCIRLTFKLQRFSEGEGSGESSDSELDMEPCTSRQALERQALREQKKEKRCQQITYRVGVIRRFDDVGALDRIQIQINLGDWQQMSIQTFHSIFFEAPQHESNLLHYEHRECIINWLKIIQVDSDSYRGFRGERNPFDTFAKMFDRQEGENQELLQSLTTNCLAINEATRLSERRFVLSIFGKVRDIFEYITANEYTVWFFVPRLNHYLAMDKVSIDDFDLCNVRTCIKLTSDNTDFFWHHADHNIMDILLVAFQLTLAQITNQSVVFLSHLENLADYTCVQYVKASFMNSFYANEPGSTKWICIPYLHRIIDVSESLNLNIFIEYPSRVTLLPENRSIFNCVQQHKEGGRGGTITWMVNEDATKNIQDKFKSLKRAMNMD